MIDSARQANTKNQNLSKHAVDAETAGASTQNKSRQITYQTTFPGPNSPALSACESSNPKTESSRAQFGPEPKDQYVYRPLEATQIRLLGVYAGEEEEPIKCSMIHENLSAVSDTNYNTISYHWDDTTEWTTIELDQRVAIIPLNAAAAIRRMRNKHELTILWIDSVCIDQRNGDEKRGQVEMMDKIFASSNHNLIFLGEAEQTDRNALLSIKLIRDEVETKAKLHNEYDVLNPADPDRLAEIMSTASSLIWSRIDSRGLSLFFSKGVFRFGHPPISCYH